MLSKKLNHGRIKPKRFVDELHLANVRAMPCCCCGAGGPSHAHHLLRGPVRGMGLRAGDEWVIPMCHMCHSDLHDRSGDEVSFLAGHGIDGVALAKELWRESNES